MFGGLLSAFSKFIGISPPPKAEDSVDMNIPLKLSILPVDVHPLIIKMREWDAICMGKYFGGKIRAIEEEAQNERKKGSMMEMRYDPKSKHMMQMHDLVNDSWHSDKAPQ